MKMLRLLVVYSVLLVMAAYEPVFAKTIYVKASAKGKNDGSSWTNAYKDLQNALDSAMSGDEIWVAAGVYNPTSGTDQTIVFTMKSGVDMYGGFKGDETKRSQRNWATYESILSGNIADLANNKDNSFRVLNGASNAALDGFVIADGFTFDRDGPGMLNDGVSPEIVNCVFRHNYTMFGTGGGILNINGAAPDLSNCAFHNNSAKRSGAVYTNGGKRLMTIINCNFDNNSAEYDCAAIYASKTPITVANCTFTTNSAYSGGTGGLLVSGSTATVTNSVFSGNFSFGFGGAINITGSAASLTNCVFNDNLAEVGGALNCADSTITVTQCTFWDNTAVHFGGCICIGGEMFVTNSIIWGSSSDPDRGNCDIHSDGTPVIRNCNIETCGGSGAKWDKAIGRDGGGNIAADPRFVSIEQPAGADGVWRTYDDGLKLKKGSPCINAGLGSAVPAKDILERSRVGAPDMGAYEWQLPKNNASQWQYYQ